MIRPVLVDRIPLEATPAAIFDKLPLKSGRILLESVGGPSNVTEWSFIAHEPFLTLRANHFDVEITTADVVHRRQAPPFDVLDELRDRYCAEHDPSLPPFQGGLAGYIAYDAGRCIERLPSTAAKDVDTPDMHFGAYDAVIAIHHPTGIAHILGCPTPERSDMAMRAAQKLASFVRKHATSTLPLPNTIDSSVEIRSNFSRARYIDAVARAIEYVHAGDVFQVNIAQRFEADLPASPWNVYCRLRHLNPSPFAAFFDAGNIHVVSASPERFLRTFPESSRVCRVETMPIKGTRPRRTDPEEDRAMHRELLASEKDRAELAMIIDLERNDLGRVCAYGSVRVRDARRVEAYATVLHTVATVEGTLRPDVTTGQLLKATFPGGSITGAPKIRAMEIIEALEGVRRGIYCGAIGYVSWSGALDMNIAIRTIVCVGSKVYFHAGGGIVADSEPENEYDETLHKARALLDALLDKNGPAS